MSTASTTTCSPRTRYRTVDAPRHPFSSDRRRVPTCVIVLACSPRVRFVRTDSRAGSNGPTTPEVDHRQPEDHACGRTRSAREEGRATRDPRSRGQGVLLRLVHPRERNQHPTRVRDRAGHRAEPQGEPRPGSHGDRGDGVRPLGAARLRKRPRARLPRAPARLLRPRRSVDGRHTRGRRRRRRGAVRLHSAPQLP